MRCRSKAFTNRKCFSERDSGQSKTTVDPKGSSSPEFSADEGHRVSVRVSSAWLIASSLSLTRASRLASSVSFSLSCLSRSSAGRKVDACRSIAYKASLILLFGNRSHETSRLPHNSDTRHGSDWLTSLRRSKTT
eukprot:Skav203907  [mRNA]  locus=scaffold1649:354036:358166:+ [translate_table: standard]